jgi:hypothetical protein
MPKPYGTISIILEPPFITLPTNQIYCDLICEHTTSMPDTPVAYVPWASVLAADKLKLWGKALACHGSWFSPFAFWIG